MAELGKDTDQSMEDILQSIKRIIADEGDEPAPATGSDVLELTELLAEDVAVPEPMPVPTSIVAKSAQDDIDALFAAPLPEVAPEPEPTPLPEPEPEPMVVAPPPPAPVEVDPQPAPAMEPEKLMSDATLAASVAALHALANKHEPMLPPPRSLAFRSGTTVEDLVMEAMKPMLKDWLDENLPLLVRTLVEKEIRRLHG